MKGATDIMPSYFKIYGLTEDSKEWFSQHFSDCTDWKYDDILSSYHCDDIYTFPHEDCAVFEDFSETQFFGWETDDWIKLATGKELVFGHYEENNGNVEFIHIKDNICTREYRIYNFDKDETNTGNEPQFDDWEDAASYIDKIF